MQLQLEVPSDSTGNPYHIHLTLPFRLCKPFFSTTCFECQKPRVRLASYLHGCDFAWYPRVAPATHVGQVHPISSCVDPDCTRSCTPNNIRDPVESTVFFDFGNKNLSIPGGSQESGLGRSQGHWPGVLLCKGRFFLGLIWAGFQ